MDEEQERAALATMSDVSKWHDGTCPTCGGPIRWRHTGLRTVAETGDENAAGKEIEHARSISYTADMLNACERINMLADAIRESRVADEDAINQLLQIDNQFIQGILAKVESQC